VSAQILSNLTGILTQEFFLGSSMSAMEGGDEGTEEITELEARSYVWAS
jgi:hypothetical protein